MPSIKYRFSSSKCSGALLIAILFTPTVLFSQSDALFDDNLVPAVYISLPPDSLNYLLANQVNDIYLHADFVFDDGQVRDTVADAGLRLRGNTSLGAQKKSFKVSFNEFVPGRRYQGVKKLNLIGMHNDPTMIRQKLFYDVWKKAGMPERRISFLRLYINGDYRGLYTNAEEIDKIWLEKTYGNNGGNLYKCTWPADLVYLGPDQQTYKNILNSPDTRAYDLTTNETSDDYSRLVALITALNKPVDAGFPAEIQQILAVNDVLKAFAIDVATGNWDDYFYLKNNYYLYDNPATGRFEFTTYDTDNTFGVDWLGKDWAKRSCLQWQNSGEPRPMASKLLAVPEFRDRFVRYLDTIARLIVLPDSIYPHIDALHTLITPAAHADLYRTLDYGYSIDDFHNGFTASIDGHTPYGIKPFLAIRVDSIFSQIAGLLSATTTVDSPRLIAYPSPAGDWLYIDGAEGQVNIEILDALGRSAGNFYIKAENTPIALPVDQLRAGLYFLKMRSGNRSAGIKWVKGPL